MFNSIYSWLSGSNSSESNYLIVIKYFLNRFDYLPKSIYNAVYQSTVESVTFQLLDPFSYA